MTIPPELVRLWNAAHPRLALTEARLAELPVELQQLRAAAEAARGRVAFDTEPSAFRRLLAETAKRS
ncbi:hypothetical protein [Paracraurococcus ruber]|uniref:hypothetical protein n=1 Tax=Paracraurococcus ruber TaxID=77675 RepID=UPI001305283F|nr:hypothetical protein [Paracraurococcus ruber]